MTATLQDFKAELFRSLANSVRIRILEELRGPGRLTVSEIQRRLAIEPSNASQHLSILRGHGIVTTQRDGTRIWYSIAAPEWFELLDVARIIFEKQLTASTRLLAEEGPALAAPARKGRNA
jgi:ArsR family transcriptional regulator